MKKFNNSKYDPLPKKSKKPIILSFNYAVDGILYCFKNERNFRFHIFSSIILVLLCLFFDISKVEMAIICCTAAFVVFSEMINTAVEKVVDLIYTRYDSNAKIAKDVAAGAVLVSAFNAIFVGYFIFYNRILPLSDNLIIKIKKSPLHLTFISFILVFLIIIILKSIFLKHNTTYLQGGTVSGHAAIAFCAATIITLMSGETLVAILAYLIAFLVAQSRLEGKIHTISELIFGALTGTGIAALLFKFMS